MTTSIITRGSGVSIAGRQPRGVSPAFSRASFAFQSDGRLVGVGVPRFETVGGRRGVLVEEGTTNLILNGDIENDTNGWTQSAYRGSGIFDVAEPGYRSNRCLQITASVDYSRLAWVSPAAHLAEGVTYTASVMMRIEQLRLGYAGIAITPSHSNRAVAYAWLASQQTTYGDWALLAGKFKVSEGQGGNFQFRLWAEIVDAGCVVQFDRLQVESKPYATSFVDGTRANDVLTLNPMALGVRDEGPWSLECWAKTSISTAVWRMVMDAWPKFYVGISPSGLAGVSWMDGTQVVHYGPVIANPNGWHHWVLTYDGSNCRVHVDGALVLDKPGTLRSGFPGVIRIASAYSIGAPWNGDIQQLRIYRRILSAEEIAAHAADTIVASDCYHYPFDGNLWPAPGSLGAVVAPSIITRPGKLEVIGR